MTYRRQLGNKYQYKLEVDASHCSSPTTIPNVKW